MQAPMTPQINLTELTAGRSDFNAHYSVPNQQNFAPDIVVSLSALKTAVEVNGGISNVQQIALRLIHRYIDQWFLTLEVCEMDLATGQIIAAGNRFDLNQNGTITPSAFQGSYDPTYFNTVLCDNKAINPQQYVNSLLFPWYQQVLEMSCENGLLNNAEAMVTFAACSYDYTAYPKVSLVPFPHIVLIFNAAGSTVYVNDTAYNELMKYKAADMGGQCPPCCNQYSWPASLPKVPTCLS